MTVPQWSDEEGKGQAASQTPSSQEGQPPIADGAGEPKRQAAGKPAKKKGGLVSRLPALIGIGVVLGLIVAAGIVFAYRSGVFGDSVKIKTAAQANVPKGPLAPFAKGSLAKMTTYESPQKVDNIAFGDRNRKEVKLSDFKGQVVVLNVWATWCAPCRYEMPTLARLQGMYPDQVKVVALSVDVADKFPDVVSFMDVQQPLEVYTDTKFAAPSKFQVQGMPATFILNKNGDMVARLDGEASWDTPEVKALIDKLLSE